MFTAQIMVIKPDNIQRWSDLFPEKNAELESKMYESGLLKNYTINDDNTEFRLLSYTFDFEEDYNTWLAAISQDPLWIERNLFMDTNGFIVVPV